MLQAANPIYDIIFKYLLEDNRIAKTILSALLKKDVVEVHVRKHEYTNSTRDTLSIFRIDFGATIRDDEGNERLVLIELQKTWLETETLRFRQYLGVHYASPENILPDSEEGFAIPMITVYLLGHKVGGIEEPVLYVNRKAFNYDGKEVTTGLPDPFVDSLTHDSIIVQIPRLKGQMNNRMEKILSIFDQSKKDKSNRHVLNLDEEDYANDDEMQLIVNRLVKAASNVELRHDMNVEDEYFSAIEHRDTTILLRDKKIAEQGAQLKEQGAQLKEQGAQLKEQGVQLKEQGVQLKEQGVQLKEKDAKIKAQEESLKTTVRMLLQAGVQKEVIAVSLGKTLEDIESIFTER